MKLFFLIMILFTSSTSFGISITADEIAKDAQWAVLLEKVITEGTPADTIMGKIYGLSQKTVIEENKKWSAVHITVAGEHSFMSGYTVTQVSLSLEEWQLSEAGNSWVITQYFYYMDPAGKFKYAQYRVVEKFNDSSITMKDIEKGSIEEQKEKWVKLLNLWLEPSL
ncbi:MAG: hypothetical protein IT287_03410 [Bdellovibrionaceae bacterium]|nr:hypothetical protein [Pseudobdellovibrionaceae bacterium]